MSKQVRKAGLGPSVGAQLAGEAKRREDACRALRARHAEYLKECGVWFSDRPFRAQGVPGWIYLPTEDLVILESTLARLRGMPDF